MSWIITPRMVTPLATGGDSVQDVFINGRMYRIHTFSTVGSSSLVVSRGGSFEYLVVAGGGGSGGIGTLTASGAGGAGGLLTNIGGSPLSLSTGNFVVTVGAGGAGGGNDQRGLNGNDSIFHTLMAVGGGGGGGGNANVNGANGGSGGGGGSNGIGGAGTAGQGNAGANQWGRGGGAGQSGISGGQGLLVNITGTPTYYAGGGQSPFPATPVLGGGGRGEGTQSSGLAENGTPNTGGGGGARWGALLAGRSGGSGIVIVRYAIA